MVKGLSNWLWFTCVQSCFFSVVTDQSNIVFYFYFFYCYCFKLSCFVASVLL